MSFLSTIQQLVSDAEDSISSLSIRDGARKLFSGKKTEDNEKTSLPVKATTPRFGTPLVVPNPPEQPEAGSSSPVGAILKKVPVTLTSGVSKTFNSDTLDITFTHRRASSLRLYGGGSLSSILPQKGASFEDGDQRYFRNELDVPNKIRKKSSIEIKFSERNQSSEKALEKLNAQSLSCFREMPERWAEVTETRSGSAQIDNEFLELYGGLQSHHEEKRQSHFLMLKQTNEAQSSSDAPPAESCAKIFPQPSEISPEDVSIPPLPHFQGSVGVSLKYSRICPILMGFY